MLPDHKWVFLLVYTPHMICSLAIDPQTMRSTHHTVVPQNWGKNKPFLFCKLVIPSVGYCDSKLQTNTDDPEVPMEVLTHVAKKGHYIQHKDTQFSLYEIQVDSWIPVKPENCIGSI